MVQLIGIRMITTIIS